MPVLMAFSTIGFMIGTGPVFGYKYGAVFLLPLILGLNGIWLSVIVAEACAMILSFTFLIGRRKPTLPDKI